MKENLLKKVYLVTPNIPEAEVLTKTKIKNLEDMIRVANILLKLGVKNVLIKGGHRNTKIIQDVLLNKKGIKILKIRKLILKTPMEPAARYQVQSLQHFLHVEKA